MNNDITSNERPAMTLIERLEALGKAGENFLDVQIEIALFKPHGNWVSVCANDAQTKVIYTNADGEEDTCWADDWSTAANRAKTISALRAQGASNE